MTSGCSWITNSRAALSSSENAVRLYVPGRSTKRISTSADMCTPSFFSTVLPGQLPTCWDNPVSMLKTVDFPTFGWPARPTSISLLSAAGFTLDTRTRAASSLPMARRVSEARRMTGPAPFLSIFMVAPETSPIAASRLVRLSLPAIDRTTPSSPSFREVTVTPDTFSM